MLSICLPIFLCFSSFNILLRTGVGKTLLILFVENTQIGERNFLTLTPVYPMSPRDPMSLQEIQIRDAQNFLRRQPSQSTFPMNDDNVRVVVMSNRERDGMQKGIDKQVRKFVVTPSFDYPKNKNS